MSVGAFDPRLNKTLGTPQGASRRFIELEKRVAQLEARMGPPGRRVFWAELTGPVSAANPPTTTVTFNIVVPGTYLVAGQFTAFTTAGAAGQLDAKELYADGVLVNSTGQYMSPGTAGSHLTVAMEAGIVEWDVGSHTLGLRWSGTNASSDTNDRMSFYAWRTT